VFSGDLEHPFPGLFRTLIRSLENTGNRPFGEAGFEGDFFRLLRGGGIFVIRLRLSKVLLITSIDNSASGKAGEAGLLTHNS
jgi:arabinogalactan endo-1,4-beta-galactosidase